MRVCMVHVAGSGAWVLSINFSDFFEACEGRCFVLRCAGENGFVRLKRGAGAGCNIGTQPSFPIKEAALGLLGGDEPRIVA
jgi:hypothetical protein